MATQALPSYLSASSFTSVVDGVTQTGVATVVVSSVLPTQQLPTYLSASTFVTTVNGAESTGTTLVKVPLTYIGPSIPLGTDGVWTFIGSTTPASLTSTQSPTAIPSSSTQSGSTITSSPSASTFSFSSLSSGSTGSLSSSSFSSLSSGSTGSLSSSSLTSSTSPASTTSAAATSGSSGLSTGQLIGIIIAAIIVAAVIILLLILCFFRRRRQRNGYHHPNLSDFVIVDSEGQPRLAGEGSPRPTGEEEDSFLRGSRSGETNNEMREIGPVRLVQNSSPTATERTTGTTVPPEGIVPSAVKTPSGSPSPPRGPKLPNPFFHASASSLFFSPTRGPDQSLTGAAIGAVKRESGSTRGSTVSTDPSGPANGNAGRILSPAQLSQIDDEWRQESNGGHNGGVGFHRRPSELGERTGSPLRPPPAIRGESNSSRQDSSMRTLGSPGSDDDERTTLLMAQRFNMSESGPAVLVQSGTEASTPSSWRSSIGFGIQGLRLSRLSWFQRMNLHRAHTPSSGSALPATRSVTPSRQQLRPTETQASLGVPRPVSDLTASSTGETTYYDAPSGPSTMSSRSVNNRSRSLSPGRPTSMPPVPPRAMIMADTTGPRSAPQTPRAEYDQDSGNSSSFGRPALLLLDPPATIESVSAPGSTRVPSPPPMPPSLVQARTEPTDILDTPVPPRAAVSPYSTTSTRGGPTVPPGLEHLANIRVWRDSSSDMPSSATFGEGSDRDMNVDIIGAGGDVLEEAPPSPAANWAALRAVTIADTIASNRTRRTLGQIDDPLDDVHSSRASLHSIPDRLSPLSPMGSGSNSRAPSRQYNSSSVGSNSSRFSGGQLLPSTSNNGTSGSSGSLLGHSNSITSDERRRPRREPGEPAGLTPSSSSLFRGARLSAIGGQRTSMTTPQRSPAADATFGQPSTMHEGTGALVGRTT